MWGLGSQGVELFGGCEAFCSLLDQQLPFLEHVHEVDADQRALGCLKRLEAQHGASDPFDAAMVLLHQIIQMFHLADGDRGPVRLVVPEGSKYSKLAFQQGQRSRKRESLLG
jgi:hypothetical protein